MLGVALLIFARSGSYPRCFANAARASERLDVDMAVEAWLSAMVAVVIAVVFLSGRKAAAAASEQEAPCGEAALEPT